MLHSLHRYSPLLVPRYSPQQYPPNPFANMTASSPSLFAPPLVNTANPFSSTFVPRITKLLHIPSSYPTLHRPTGRVHKYFQPIAEPDRCAVSVGAEQK